MIVCIMSKNSFLFYNKFLNDIKIFFFFMPNDQAKKELNQIQISTMNAFSYNAY